MVEGVVHHIVHQISNSKSKQSHELGLVVEPPQERIDREIANHDEYACEDGRIHKSIAALISIVTGRWGKCGEFHAE